MSNTGEAELCPDNAMSCISPQPGPQSAFLSSDADIVIYGGAAGGGKTYALLMEALRNVDVPGIGAGRAVGYVARAVCGAGADAAYAVAALDISVGREDFICVSGGRRGGAEVAGQSDCPYLL